MRIYAMTMVKNEADIIESFCRYTLTYCDGLMLYDDNSFDATRDIIHRLMEEYPGRIDLTIGGPQIGHRQKEVCNVMARRAIAEYNAGFIVPLDADEFIITDTNENPRALLEALEQDKIYQVPWRTYAYEKDPVDNTLFLPANFSAYRLPEYETHFKVMAGARVMGEYDYIIDQGSHILFPQENSPEVEIVELPSIIYAHFPLRSVAQVTSKIIIGWVNYLSMRRDIADWAYHWHNIYDKIKQNGGLSPADVTQLSLTYEFPSERLEDRVETQPDDTWKGVDIQLQYTDYAKTNVYLPRLLDHLETNIRQFHDLMHREELARDAMQQGYEEKLAEAHTTLQGIYASRSWRLAQRFQKFFNLFSKAK